MRLTAFKLICVLLLIIVLLLGTTFFLFNNKDNNNDDKSNLSSSTSSIVSGDTTSTDTSSENTSTSSEVTSSKDTSSKNDTTSSEITSSKITSSDITSSEDTSSVDDSKPSIDPSDWNLIVANEKHPLPLDFSVKTKQLPNGKEVDERAYDSLMSLLNDADAEGHSLIVCSAYRSIEYQEGLFEAQINRHINEGMTKDEAYNLAKTVVAVPGVSEHHTGLAVDIVSMDYQNLDEGIKDTPDLKWVGENCQEYGFILRYPENKSDITGIIFEPWHFRYVGVEAATYIMENGICFEEYMGVD